MDPRPARAQGGITRPRRPALVTMRVDMLATRVLVRHQRNLRRLFAQIRRSPSSDRGRKAALFDEIKRSIRAQLSVEEEMLYPTLSGRPSPDRGSQFEALLQHHFEIEELVAELAALGQIG